MRFRQGALGVIILLSSTAYCQKPSMDSAECVTCHAGIAEAYSKTGMARSFTSASRAPQIEKNTVPAFYHAPSNTWFQNIEREGKLFQRQYQTGPGGQQLNITETPIDYIMGSGDHARTYLHRTEKNELIELPLGWYAERGGYWAMNPGYDRPDHAGLSRSIPYGCMFCHNGYPQVPPGTNPRAAPVYQSVPEGINCQRCHGDGLKHVQLARLPNSPVADIRSAIVNPSRLSTERRLDVCLQCHMEPRSSSTSSLIVRYEREPFSYKPGEALSEFRLHFDQRSAASTGDRFEIVGSASYRLMQSQCFLQSKGALTCTTCHDPHRQLEAQQAAQHSAEVCLKCHASKLAQLIAAQTHPADHGCVSCHMPKRRTQDAVHVVMTDHLIRRQKPNQSLLADLREELPSDSSAPVAPYYPTTPSRAEDELYLGVAQVNEKSARSEGIQRLTAALEKFRPSSAEFYLQLGDALRASRRFEEAIAPYREAVRLEPGSASARERLAFGLTRVRQFDQADREFREAERLTPKDARLMKDIGISYLEQGRFQDAEAQFAEAISVDPTLHEAHNGLGGSRLKTGDRVGAEAEFRRAIELRPHYAEAQHNLAFLLSGEGRFDEARYFFEESLRINGNNTATLYDFATALWNANLGSEAEQQLANLFRTDPNHPRALDLQGRLFEAKQDYTHAVQSYRKAVSLDAAFSRAVLHLGAALARSGDLAEARRLLQKAAESNDPIVRAEAGTLLKDPRLLK